ncbi:MAG TPA: T9SS type A sorting domain-containing protein [Flavobacteriaceae bacterium]|nr:T9SS type A sorting domain-containing protein [Flavobacteriaceae bacterium]|tara:strand:- start:423 stop:1697 length:1275 start_codon:yes stop_codon:yes gene_type:complete
MEKFLFFLLLSIEIIGQNYTSYFTGNSENIYTETNRGICLMGGSTEDDNAMIWFLEQANGGDILVLRTSGSDGYNNYLYNELGIDVNSVETIVLNNNAAVNETYIHQKISNAEAIWFAGGNQWNYINYLRGTEVNNLINEAITNRNIVIGGTSAGMAIMGGFYFTAENGTVTSEDALSNPYDEAVSVDGSPFLEVDFLSNVITDQHYDDPNRKGRHAVFMSRILTDYGIPANGIACDEYTAVCIDSFGNARVFGEYPNYDDNAYFLQVNCEVSNNYPEVCSSGVPLEWNMDNNAIKVYNVKGTINGENSFNVSTWSSGIGGLWQEWYILNGQLFENQSNEIECQSMFNAELQSFDIKLHPNPSSDYIYINTDSELEAIVYNLLGKQVMREYVSDKLDISCLEKGTYIVNLTDGIYNSTQKIIKN